MSFEALLDTSIQRMVRSIEALQGELAKLRTGRAHPGLIENVMVESYGSEMPLMQMASIVAEDARTLVVNAWDKSQITAIEKSIIAADLGLNPVVQGTVMRIPLPPLTQERRDHMIKLVRATGETARVAIRNIRRDALNELKQMKKEKLLTEDDERQGQVRMQKITDDFVEKVEHCISEKEEELKVI